MEFNHNRPVHVPVVLTNRLYGYDFPITSLSFFIILSFWCVWSYSKRHAHYRRWNLNPVCLPISPQTQNNIGAVPGNRTPHLMVGSHYILPIKLAPPFLKSSNKQSSSLSKTLQETLIYFRPHQPKYIHHYT